jgi:hypothetical protein
MFLETNAMAILPIPPLDTRARNLFFFSSPSFWPLWPFLPVVRQRPDQPAEPGVLYDALAACGLPGYSATVFLTNVGQLPGTLDALLELPRHVYDTPEEIFADGWRVD